jgi:NADPH:quinone reductase-like Zn-dependent oxidoreductase
VWLIRSLPRTVTRAPKPRDERRWSNYRVHRTHSRLTTNINTYEFVTKNVTIHGVGTGSREMLEEMAQLIDDHGIVPVLDSIYTVDQIHEALQRPEQGEYFGKICSSWVHLFGHGVNNA